MSTSALTRMLVELNRAVPRVNLRALADGVLAGGPSTVPPEELGPAQLRDEVATLSTFFIVELWSYLARFLDGIGVTLATPSRTGDGFAPLAELVGEDPVCEAATCIETLLISFGRFTEHRLGSAGGTEGAIFARYRELLVAMGGQTPTTHGAGNALAGMQITLALAEVAPRAFALQHGRPMDRTELDELLASDAFEQLLSAIGASSARVSNAVIATLSPHRFPRWGHSLLAMPADERSARRFEIEPATMTVAFADDGPRLDVKPDTLARIRSMAEQIATPGRTHQLACPAFAAPAAPDSNVFAAFSRWLVAVCRSYFVPRWTS